MSQDVTNPRHTYLRNLLTQVGTVQDQIKGNLRRPAANMASRKVWTSVTATTFEHELTAGAGRYASAVTDLGTKVHEELRACPPTCLAAEAKMWSRDL
ncbi:hypothetical protein ACIBG8_04345 [Nonomuraea sp. NPDC050556]|uniref:hypothetical protein n=1 Tax=Nonomuraea sp. NPDC050556 TaxID=3364369 RepID=UPI0037899C54